MNQSRKWLALSGVVVAIALAGCSRQEDFSSSNGPAKSADSAANANGNMNPNPRTPQHAQGKVMPAPQTSAP